MIRSFYAAFAGMQARQIQTETLAANIANTSTPGYKRAAVRFAEVLADQVQGGVQVAEVSRDLAPGPVLATGDPFDLALRGPGYFRLEGADGRVAYTRAGRFTPGPDGRLLGPGGLALTGDAGPLTLPPGTTGLRLEPGGTLVALGPRGEVRPVGRLVVAQFDQPAALTSLGENLWAPAPAAGPARFGAPGEAGFGPIEVGALEQSNVELATEMTDLILAQRYYQLNLRALQTADEMVSLAADLRRG